MLIDQNSKAIFSGGSESPANINIVDRTCANIFMGRGKAKLDADSEDLFMGGSLSMGMVLLPTCQKKGRYAIGRRTHGVPVDTIAAASHAYPLPQYPTPKKLFLRIWNYRSPQLTRSAYGQQKSSLHNTQVAVPIRTYSITKVHHST
jgi:hypothetical protein